VRLRRPQMLRLVRASSSADAPYAYLPVCRRCDGVYWFLGSKNRHFDPETLRFYETDHEPEGIYEENRPGGIQIGGHDTVSVEGCTLEE